MGDSTAGFGVNDDRSRSCENESEGPQEFRQKLAECVEMLHFVRS